MVRRMYRVDVYLRVLRAVMVDGMSIREAARTFGLHRDTVRKMVACSVPPGYRRQTPPGGCFFAIGAPMGHSQPPAPAEPNRTPRW